MNRPTMNINESAENYLETILILSKRLPVVRSVDIANELGFKKPSVSIAMKNLRLKEHIRVTDAGFIYLTDQLSGHQGVCKQASILILKNAVILLPCPLDRERITAFLYA